MIILASKSPRRHELLKKVVDKFEIIPANINEDEIEASTNELAMKISQMKAYKIAATHPNDLVLAVDTIVVLGDTVFGQPESPEHAKWMLHQLSGKTHHVISGFTIIDPDHEISRSVVTTVTFNELSDKMIDAYVATGEPQGKSGSYGIQDIRSKKYNFVKSVDGSVDNVVGLPTEELLKFKHLFEKNR